MTRKEKQTLRRALRLLWQGTAEGEDGFEQAIRLLLPMAGMTIPALDALDRVRVITLPDLIRRYAEDRESEETA